MLEFIIGILFSVGAADALVPLLIIIILIVAAAGATRGYSIFNVFGIAALAGVGAGRGSIQGRSALGRYFLMAERPGQSKVSFGRWARGKIGAARERGIRIGNKQITKGTQLKKDLAKERARRREAMTSGSAIGIATPKPEPKPGRVKLATQKAGGVILGKPESNRRKLARVASILVPPVGAGLAMSRIMKTRSKEGKSSIRWRGFGEKGSRTVPFRYEKRDIKKRSTELDKHAKGINEKQTQLAHYRRARDAYASDPGRVIPPSILKKMAQAKEALAKGTISQAEYDKLMNKYTLQASKSTGLLARFSPSATRRSEARGMRMVKRGRSPYGSEEVAGAMVGTRAAAAAATRSLLDRHTEAIVNAEERKKDLKNYFDSGQPMLNGKVDVKGKPMTEDEYKAKVKELNDQIKESQAAYRSALKDWQQSEGIGGRKLGATQATILRQIYRTGRGIGTSVKEHGVLVPTTQETAESLGSDNMIVNPKTGRPWRRIGGTRDNEKGRDPTRLTPHRDLSDKEVAEGSLSSEDSIHKAVMNAAGFETLSKKARKKRAETGQPLEGERMHPEKDKKDDKE